MSFLAVLLLALTQQLPPEWRLDDQFGRPHASTELAGAPVLLIAGAPANGAAR